ncbi:MAG: hypothetical protein J2P27_02630 [Actinobacteria bacterium]|nr:hypothetical protein [Actinomycetota bacterium]
MTSAGAIVGLAAAIVAVAGGAIAVYRGAVELYRRTVGSRRALARQLYQLAAGVTIRWVEDRLGAPAFSREFAALPNVRELVYHTRHAWIQVLADEHDAVMRFSITVIDPRFWFQVRDLTNYQLAARLGRTSFAAVDAQVGPQGRSFRIGAHNYEYAEAYWFGNPGGYQWYVLSRNDASSAGTMHWPTGDHALLSFQEGVLLSDDEGGPSSSPQLDELSVFRARTTINTLTVLGPWRAHGDRLLGRTSLAEPRGPDSNQVRVLVPDARERRKRRRMVQKLSRKIERDMKRG